MKDHGESLDEMGGVFDLAVVGGKCPCLAGEEEEREGVVKEVSAVCLVEEDSVVWMELWAGVRWGGGGWEEWPSGREGGKGVLI